MVFLDAYKQHRHDTFNLARTIFKWLSKNLQHIYSEVTSVTTVGGLGHIYMWCTCVDSLLQSTDWRHGKIMTLVYKQSSVLHHYKFMTWHERNHYVILWFHCSISQVYCSEAYNKIQEGFLSTTDTYYTNLRINNTSVHDRRNDQGKWRKEFWTQNILNSGKISYQSILNNAEGDFIHDVWW